MFGLTQLGVVHTAISLIALVRDRKITPRNLPGKIYILPGAALRVRALRAGHAP